MQATTYLFERRRRDLRGRVARASYPVRQALGEFASGFPCNVIGHRWIEVRPGFGGVAAQGKMHFKCARCALSAGFTN
jgi:hypothetical protein